MGRIARSPLRFEPKLLEKGKVNTRRWREDEHVILIDTVFFQFRAQDVSSDPHRPSMQIINLILAPSKLHSPPLRL